MTPVRVACVRVGPSNRGSRMPKRPSMVTRQAPPALSRRRRRPRGSFASHAGQPTAGYLASTTDDLTGRPGVDITEDAFADLLSQRSPHARSPPCRGNTSGEQKGTHPVTAPRDTMIARPSSTPLNDAKSREPGLAAGRPEQVARAHWRVRPSATAPAANSYSAASTASGPKGFAAASRSANCAASWRTRPPATKRCAGAGRRPMPP